MMDSEEYRVNDTLSDAKPDNLYSEQFEPTSSPWQ